MAPGRTTELQRLRRGAWLAPAALLAILWLAPSSPWRLPVALLALVWAPGRAILAAVYPVGQGRLAGLERVALASAIGLLTIPVLGLAVSLVWSLTPLHVAAASLGLVVLASAAAALRVPSVPGPPRARALAPSTRVTLAVCAAAALAAAAIVAVPLSTRAPTTASIGLTDAGTGTANLTREVAVGAAMALNLTLRSGDAPSAGHLVATLSGPEGMTVLLDEMHSLAPSQGADIRLEVPPMSEGRHELTVTWGLAQPRSVHAWFDAGPGNA